MKKRKVTNKAVPKKKPTPKKKAVKKATSKKAPEASTTIVEQIKKEAIKGLKNFKAKTSEKAAVKKEKKPTAPKGEYGWREDSPTHSMAGLIMAGKSKAVVVQTWTKKFGKTERYARRRWHKCTVWLVERGFKLPESATALAPTPTNTANKKAS